MKMTNRQKQNVWFGAAGVLIFLAALVFGLPSARAEETAKAVPESIRAAQTGVFVWKNTGDPVWVSVPQELNANRKYPLFFVFPAPEEKVEEHAKSWAALSDQLGLIVAVPSLAVRSGEVTDPHEAWLLKLRKDLLTAYTVAEYKVFAVGYGERAAFAAALAVNHPAEFSGVALVNGSWIGPYERQIRLRTRPKQQVPVYVALKGADTAYQKQLEASAQEWQRKGYLVNIETFPETQDLASKEFRTQLYQWLQEKSDLWQDLIDKSGRSWKEKFRSFWEENFYIR